MHFKVVLSLFFMFQSFFTSHLLTRSKSSLRGRHPSAMKCSGEGSGEGGPSALRVEGREGERGPSVVLDPSVGRAVPSELFLIYP